MARLLENAEATLTWENQQNNWLVLRINVHYEGAEENEPLIIEDDPMVAYIHQKYLEKLIHQPTILRLQQLLKVYY